MWFLIGCFHASIVYLIPLYTFVNGGILGGDDGPMTSDMWIMSLCSYTSVIFVVSLKLILSSRAMTLVHLVFMISTSIGLYIVWMWASDSLLYDTSDTVIEAHSTPLFYLTLACSVCACFVSDFFVKSMNFLFWPSPNEYLRDLISKKQSIDEGDNRSRFDKIWK